MFPPRVISGGQILSFRRCNWVWILSDIQPLRAHFGNCPRHKFCC